MQKYLDFSSKGISRVVKVAAAQAFAMTPVGKAVSAARLLRRAVSGDVGGIGLSMPRARDIEAMTRIEGAFQNRDAANLISALKSGSPDRAFTMLEQYAKASDEHYGIAAELLSALGPVGKVLSSLLGGGGRSGLGRSTKAALGVVESMSDDADVLNSLVRILEGKGAKVKWPDGATLETVVDLPKSDKSSATSRRPKKPPIEPTRKTVTFEDEDRTRRLPLDHPAVSGDMIETPESSNVHSFGYDLQSHTLYVRFKFSASGVSGPRPHKPGAIYSYANVPLRLFEKMLKAPSKGKFIWDNIRIRGTYSGHRYDYALVGVQGGYVPRKATLTALGESFLKRSIFSDKGRRLRSSRPDQLVRPLVPGRQPRSGA